MDHLTALRAILSADPERLRLLALVQSLRLPDCWVGAGFLRNAVWDHLHERPPGRASEVDVIWFDRGNSEAFIDRQLEAKLKDHDPLYRWEVKNQSRMHCRNNDSPYLSAADAMRYWPETATAVAVRATLQSELEFQAPFGFDDLFGLVVRPTPRFRGKKRPVYLDRIQNKGWLQLWPSLRTAE